MTRTCPQCQRANRIPAKHLADVGKCGACGTALPAQATPLPVDAAAFDDIVAHSQVPILVDFWAAWCGPCRMVAPELDKLARSNAGRMLVLKVNVDEQPALAARYRVSSIPYLALFQDRQLTQATAGAMTATQLQAWLPR